MQKNSFESFIFEHYYGCKKFNNTITEEYQIAHPNCLNNEILADKIDCDFESMYSKDFAVLDKTQPASIFLTEGSAIEINWKRNKI